MVKQTVTSYAVNEVITIGTKKKQEPRAAAPKTDDTSKNTGAQPAPSAGPSQSPQPSSPPSGSSGPSQPSQSGKPDKPADGKGQDAAKKAEADRKAEAAKKLKNSGRLRKKSRKRKLQRKPAEMRPKPRKSRHSSRQDQHGMLRRHRPGSTGRLRQHSMDGPGMNGRQSHGCSIKSPAGAGMQVTGLPGHMGSLRRFPAAKWQLPVQTGMIMRQPRSTGG